jgi:hypothetical protein
MTETTTCSRWKTCKHSQCIARRDAEDPYVPGGCAVCRVPVRYSKSRLFWTGDGTIRTCQSGNRPH